MGFTPTRIAVVGINANDNGIALNRFADSKADLMFGGSRNESGIAVTVCMSGIKFQTRLKEVNVGVLALYPRCRTAESARDRIVKSRTNDSETDKNLDSASG